MPETDLTIIIAARNEARRALDEALGKIRELNKATARTATDFGTGLTAAISKTARAFGALVIAAEAVGLAIKLAKGDLEGFLEDLHNIPVFGKFFQASTELGESFWSAIGVETGTAAKKKVEEYKRNQDEIAAHNRHMLQEEEKRQAKLQSSRKLTEQIERAMVEATIGEHEKAAYEIRRRYNDRMAAIEEMLRLTGQLEEAEKQRLYAEQTRIAEEAKLIARQQQEREEEARRERERAAQAQARKTEELNRQREIELQLRAELDALLLTSEGKHLQARLRMVEEHYRQRLKTAGSAAEVEMLMQMRLLEVEQLLRRERSDNLPSPLLGGQRFGNQAALFRAQGASRELEELRAVRQAADRGTAMMGELLEAIRFAQNMPFWGISMDAV